MAARAAAFSDPDVIALLRWAFVPVAINCSGAEHWPGPAGAYFWRIAEQGHYAGRLQPTNTRQGQYCATANGELLASGNVREAKPLLAILKGALAAAGTVGSGPPVPVSDGRVDRPRPPVGGLVLRVWARDLPRKAERALAEPWFARAFNLDHLWITAGEAAQLVPLSGETGAGRAWPHAVVWRIARFHLVDTVRGESPPWPTEAVLQAEVRSTVTGPASAGCHLALSGRVRLAGTQRWRDDVTGASRASEAGMDLELGGTALWTGHAFAAFQLVAAGGRWGATQYNFRDDDPGPAPIGFAFELAAPEQPEGLLGDERPPARLWEGYFAGSRGAAGG